MEKSDSFDVITLSLSGDPEPLAGLYHTRTREFWSKRIEIKKYSLVDGIRSLSWKPVIIPRGSRALFNLNTPADLRRVGID
jgi:molybdopterin-guanine dinucleotide biosynthesis protein A